MNNFINKCKMISNTSQFVKIECCDSKLILNCVGEKEGILTLDDIDDKSLEITTTTEKDVKGTYEIKNILLFHKLSSITEKFSLFMKNNFPLTCNYSFGDCGNIITILSHVNDEHISNLMYDYDDDSDTESIELKGNSNIIDYN